MCRILKTAGVLTAKFDAHVGLAYDLALEGRTVGHCTGTLATCTLMPRTSMHFCTSPLGSFKVVRTFNLIKGMLTTCSYVVTPVGRISG